MKQEQADPYQLLEPTSPEQLLPSIGLWPWFVGGTLLIALAVVLSFVFRRKQSAAATSDETRDKAMDRALETLSSIRANETRQTATECSLVIRRYLADACDDPALFETHEEFIARSGSLEKLKDEARAAAVDGFDRLAALKYAPEVPDTKASEIIAQARELLDKLHRGFES